jgi:hypothetical protein
LHIAIHLLKGGASAQHHCNTTRVSSCHCSGPSGFLLCGLQVRVLPRPPHLATVGSGEDGEAQLVRTASVKAGAPAPPRRRPIKRQGHAGFMNGCADLPGLPAPRRLKRLQDNLICYRASVSSSAIKANLYTGSGLSKHGNHSTAKDRCTHLRLDLPSKNRREETWQRASCDSSESGWHELHLGLRRGECPRHNNPSVLIDA